jgi:deoxyribose-phosphate aldolase
VALYEVIDLLRQSGVDYFKTNTGLIKQDFDKLLASILFTQMLMKDMDIPMDIKASGGIRTEKQVKKLIQLGVKRIGTSSIQVDDPADHSAKVGEEESNE